MDAPLKMQYVSREQIKLKSRVLNDTFDQLNRSP